MAMAGEERADIDSTVVLVRAVYGQSEVAVVVTAVAVVVREMAEDALRT